MTHSEHVLQLAREKGVIAASDLKAQGIPRQYLYRLQQSGKLERIERGLYALPEADITEHHTVVEAARFVPHGVICLLSALRFHKLTTQAPYEVWVAIENSARRPQPETLPLRVVYMSGPAFEKGIDTHVVEGVTVPIYTIPKTIADCFKFRNQVGSDVAVEALRDYSSRPDFDLQGLWDYAGICRVQNVIRPYLDAIT